MKNNKSAGCDQIKAKLIKYGDDIIYDGIAQTTQLQEQLNILKK